MVTNKEFYQKYLLKVKERRTEFSVYNAVKQLKKTNKRYLTFLLMLFSPNFPI